MNATFHTIASYVSCNTKVVKSINLCLDRITASQIQRLLFAVHHSLSQTSSACENQLRSNRRLLPKGKYMESSSSCDIIDASGMIASQDSIVSRNILRQLQVLLLACQYARFHRCLLPFTHEFPERVSPSCYVLLFTQLGEGQHEQ